MSRKRKFKKVVLHSLNVNVGGITLPDVLPPYNKTIHGLELYQDGDYLEIRVGKHTGGTHMVNVKYYECENDESEVKPVRIAVANA